MSEKIERNQSIFQAYNNGSSVAEIVEKFGISKQRVWQILKKPKGKKEQYFPRKMENRLADDDFRRRFVELYEGGIPKYRMEEELKISSAYVEQYANKYRELYGELNTRVKPLTKRQERILQEVKKGILSGIAIAELLNCSESLVHYVAKRFGYTLPKYRRKF